MSQKQQIHQVRKTLYSNSIMSFFSIVSFLFLWKLYPPLFHTLTKGCDILMKNMIHFIYTSLQDAISLCKCQYYISVAQYKAKHTQTKVMRKHDPNEICEYREDE